MLLENFFLHGALMGVFLMVITVDVASAGAQVGLSVVSKIVLGQLIKDSGKIGGAAKSAGLGDPLE